MKRNYISNRTFFAGALVVLALYGSVALLFRFTFARPLSESVDFYQSAPTPGSDLTSIEANSEITIPASAREIHARVSGFRELFAMVRFDLPSSELASFLAGTR